MSQTKVEAPFVENNRPFRNKIINGDMSIAQRATAATTVGNSTVTTLDRIVTQHSSDGAWTGEQHAMSLTDINTTGQSFAYEANCTTADGTIGAAQYALVSQRIEGQFLQDLRYGTSNAKTITVSFWCKSNLTGTFSLYLYKLDTTGYYIPNEFSISSANTWEYKTVTITPTAGSTTLITSSGGVIDNNNGASLEVGIVLAMGSNYQGTNSTWTSSSHYTTSNQANFLSSTDNNFSFTGFQLEIGDAATDFEHLPFDVNLKRCQRYCEVLCDTRSAGTGTFSSGDSDESLGTVGVCHGTRYAYMPFRFSTAKRSNAPTLLISNDTNHFNLINTLTNDKFSTMTSSGVHSHSTAETYFDTGSTGNLTNGATGFVRSDVSGSKILVLDEL